MNSESGNTVLRLWLLLHRVHDALALCEDSIFKEYGLTSEQFRVLGAVKESGGSLRPIDLASILERSPNSISMLVDRMVKAGLVRRTRDRKDRRAVNVTLTSKGQKALEPATPAGWEFIQKILSSVSYEERNVLVNLLEKVKYELLGYMNPELDRAEIIKRSIASQLDFYAHVAKTLPASCPEGKRQVAGRKKAS